MICLYCGHNNDESNKYCCMCGGKLEKVITTSAGYIPIDRNKEVEDIFEEYEEIEEEPVEKRDLLKTLIVIGIVSIIALGICVYISLYTYSGLSITYDESYYDYQASLQGEGMICSDGEYLYLSMEGSIYQFTYDLEEVSEVVDEYGESMFVYDGSLFYVNSDNDCYSIDLESKTKEFILENVYYVSVNDNIITYQDDSDNESIHQYNIDTKEDTKINDVQSYCITVVEDSIYYINNNSNLYVINDGEATKIVTSVADFIVYDNEIYISDYKGIKKYTEEDGLESIVSISYVYDMAFINGTLFLTDYMGCLYGHVEDDTYSVYEQSGAYDLEVMGNLFFYYNTDDGCYYVSNTDGYTQVLYEGLMHSSYKEEVEIEWEGVEEF